MNDRLKDIAEQLNMHMFLLKYVVLVYSVYQYAIVGNHALVISYLGWFMACNAIYHIAIKVFFCPNDGIKPAFPMWIESVLAICCCITFGQMPRLAISFIYLLGLRMFLYRNELFCYFRLPQDKKKKVIKIRKKVA